MYSIKKYSLIRLKDFQEFKKIQSSFLDLLEHSYGKEKYFGNDTYNKKIENRDLIIFVAIENNTEKLIGCLITKSYGKLSGLAIHATRRRKKLASNLLLQLQNERSYLYGEVSKNNFEMQELLTKLNFSIVLDKNKIIHLLTKEKDNVIFIKESNVLLTYIHAVDKTDIDRRKEFIMYEYSKE